MGEGTEGTAKDIAEIEGNVDRLHPVDIEEKVGGDVNIRLLKQETRVKQGDLREVETARTTLAADTLKVTDWLCAK